MSPTQRRLALFLVIDAVVVAGLAVWWFTRSSPNPVPANPPLSVAHTIETPAVPQAALPTVVSGVVECHGVWSGQPFWLRLSEPDPTLNGNRRLRLVYTPPARAEVEGAAIHDSPDLIIDAHLRIVQWDNRDGATGVLVADPGYRVTRELHTEGSDRTALKTRALKQAAAWDLRLAPLVSVLVSASDTPWSVPAVDFWGSRAGERLQIDGSAGAITVAGASFTLIRATDGRIAQVVDAQGQAVVTVTAWK